MFLVGEDRIELSPRVPRTRMLALHHTPKEFRIWDFGFGISDLGFEVTKERAFCLTKIRNSKSESEVLHRSYEIRNPKIRNPKFEVLHPVLRKFEIRNPKFEIRNPA